MKNQSIFILKEAEHKLYKNTMEKHAVLLPLLYEPEDLAHLSKYQLKDIFFVLYKPADQLVMYPQVSFLYSFRTVLTEYLMSNKVLKQYAWKLEGNASLSFCYMLYLANFMSDCITQYIKEYPNQKKALRLLVTHMNTEIEGLFDPTFQSIQQYPKDIMVANSNIVKYFTALFQSEQEIFHQGLKQAYSDASALYDDVFAY